jgi:hypothetical protein
MSEGMTMTEDRLSPRTRLLVIVLFTLLAWLIVIEVVQDVWSKLE